MTSILILQNRLEDVSGLELQLLTRKRCLIQGEIKVEHTMKLLDDRERAVKERENYLLQVEESVRDYSDTLKVGAIVMNRSGREMENVGQYMNHIIGCNYI